VKKVTYATERTNAEEDSVLCGDMVCREHFILVDICQAIFSQGKISLRLIRRLDALEGLIQLLAF
jgi:hypothetical protein